MFESDKKLLTKKLSEFLTQRDTDLYRIMEFQLGIESSPDKNETNIRTDFQLAEFVLEICELFNGNKDVAINFAISVILLEQFIRVHHDVQDGNTESGDRPSLWWKWGPAHAINTGDGLHALARLVLLQMNQEKHDPNFIMNAVRTVDLAILSLCEAEFLEINLQDRILFSPQDCLNIAKRKGSGLFGCAAKLGIISTPSNTKLEESFFQYGSYLGAAVLIKRDLEVINSSATAKADAIGKILTKKKNLTLSYVLESDNLKLKRRLGEIYSKRILSNKDLAEVKSIATESGAIDQTTESIAHLLEKSKEMLSDSHIEQLDLRSLETFTGKLFNT